MTQSVSLNRRRYGGVITGAERIRDDDRSLISHAERLDDIAGTLVELHHLDPHIPKATISKALCCCRILSQNAFNVYQPCNYCRQPSICPICQRLAVRGRALDFIDDLTEYGRDLVVFDLLFTMHLATSREEESFQVGIAHDAISRLLRYRRAQSLKACEADSPSQIMRITASLHLEPIASGGFMKPHLHCLFFAEPGLSLVKLRSELKPWWERATFKHLGRQGMSKIVQLGRLHPHGAGMRLSKVPFSLTWLEHKLIYNIMQTKPDEPTVDIVHRMKLLESRDVSKTSRFSRRITSLDERRYLPNAFNPVLLGHERLCVAGFDDCLPHIRPLGSYENTKKELPAIALKWLDSQIPFQWC